jgi:acyl-CoA synthetase (NDP forming)
MQTARAGLRAALLSPRSVALVGASDDVTKTASRPLRFLRRSGFTGAIYPVNPRRDTVLGERAWPSLAALPEIPDHAYIVSGTETVIGAIEECGRLGIPVATTSEDRMPGPWNRRAAARTVAPSVPSSPARASIAWSSTATSAA